MRTGVLTGIPNICKPVLRYKILEGKYTRWRFDDTVVVNPRGKRFEGKISFESRKRFGVRQRPHQKAPGEKGHGML